MTTASTPLKVLVSGASGFIAAWVVRTLLEQGHHVRGTVRSTEKGQYLKQLFKKYGDKFEYVIVEDVAKEGMFNDVVQGMDGVIHTASPFHMKADDPQELIEPAVQGTTAILESILKFAPTVKRVVITSSTAAVTNLPPMPPQITTYSEKDWNDDSPRMVAEQGRDCPQVHKYRASKSLAERAAWEFMENHKSEIGWDLVTLQPPFVFGPVIHDVSSASSLNTSNAGFLAMLKNDPPQTPEDLAKPVGNLVDVRDAAWAHAEALVNDQVAAKSNDAFDAGQGRVTLSAGPYTWQDAVDAINASSSVLPKTTQKGCPGAGKNAMHPTIIYSSRARTLLGLRFRPHGETWVDTLESFKEKGWVS